MEETAVQYELCPETGIGSLILETKDGRLKFDLMPDEVDELRGMLKSGDIEGVKELLSTVNPGAYDSLSDAELQNLIREIG